ncbi:MAG: GNAT family N-acetyltransferase [Thaumarchaeota archaeon]|nr:GNAT family N-acetyltransferase [Nitrososphaerota archaeon]
MSKKNELNANVAKKKEAGEVVIRDIKTEEIGRAAELIAKLKRLNGEFDPLLKTAEKLDDDALRTVKKAMANEDSVVLVASSSGRVVGVVKADIKDRTYYEPRIEGAIVEFYILPEFRRGSLGRDLLSSITDRLKKKGAELITAEFPSQNEIAKRFYTKLGFRSLTNVYAKSES